MTAASSWARALHAGRALVFFAAVALTAPMCVDAQTHRAASLPRTPDGRPDLQGNWTNATITPIERAEGRAPVLTPAEVRDIEGRREALIAFLSQPSDPDRPPPPVGGVSVGDARFDAASGGTGGYNYFYIDAGDEVATFNGEPRSSLITRPATGRVPALTPEGRQRLAQLRAARQQFGEYDNPENRPFGERCILSFGSNGGPPMLPNYFYNNNYTIVQTPDHIMIMTEMVHDARIIRMGDGPRLPSHVRPYFGDSRGRWAGDTLVVETTNIHPVQAANFYGASENLRVVERFTRYHESTIQYEFTIHDPATFTEPWGGEVPFRRLVDQVYEYACHEANYGLANVLSGARAQEREGRTPQPRQPR
ncbi:MAG: hypothetical protein L0271_09885 [Gemmatimonadetes bacterium]|nr:hypothetical protein [Gemmatimonadota bacterium]